MLAHNFDIGEDLGDNRVRDSPNVRLSDDVWVWESPILYQILYLMLKAKTIFGLMARFLMKVTIFIEVQVGGIGLGIGVGSKGFRNPLKVRFSYAWERVIPRSKNSWQAFFVNLW